MAAVTVSGSIGGVPISFLTSYAAQAGLAAQFLATAGAQYFTGGTGTTTASTTIDASVGGVLTGGATVGLTATTPSDIGLGANGGQGEIYLTGLTPDSVVVAADNSNSSVVNDNPFGNLVADTGAGGNVLLALAGGNTFQTGLGGSDIVFLDGASNTLRTLGADAVLVGGPSTVTAAGTGTDNILMTTGTNLSFINGTTVPGAVDTVTGAANAAITLAGTGATSIASGTGPEAFYVDTGAGKVTLNGNLQTNDALNLLKDAATTPGTANVTVNNFTATDAVNVHGYAGVQFTIAAAGTGSVLSLTDGSSVTFTNLTTAQLSAITKTT